MAIKTHTFRQLGGGKTRYYVVDGAVYDGWVDAPAEKLKRELFVSGGQSPMRELDTWIHEAVHAIGPQLKEKTVTLVATELARFLWRLGYRRKEED